MIYPVVGVSGIGFSEWLKGVGGETRFERSAYRALIGAALLSVCRRPAHWCDLAPKRWCAVNNDDPLCAPRDSPRKVQAPLE